MSTEFMRSDREIDAAVTGSTNFEQMREAMLSTLANRGVLVRSRTDAFDVRVIAPVEKDSTAPVAAEPVMQGNQDKCIRVLYPGGNARFELTGPSEQNLDEQEKKICQIYGK